MCVKIPWLAPHSSPSEICDNIHIEISIHPNPPLTFELDDLFVRVVVDGVLAYESKSSKPREGSTTTNCVWNVELGMGKLYQKFEIVLMQGVDEQPVGTLTVKSDEWEKIIKDSVLERTMDIFNGCCVLHLSVKFSPSKDPLLEEPAVDDIARQNPAYAIPQLLERGDAALERFDRGDGVAIAEAIKAFRRGSKICASWDPNRANIFNNLGLALMFRFDLFGRQKDIDDSVAARQEAVNLTPIPGYFDALGNSLWTRFNRFRHRTDIEEAIKAYRKAIELARHIHPIHQFHSHLGLALLSKFEEYGESSDIDESVQVHREAVNLIPDNHPERAEYFSRLGNSLRVLFNRFGQQNDINDAVKADQEAVNLTKQTGGPEKARFLASLGNSLRARFERFAALYPDDIRLAVKAHQEAVDITLVNPTDWNNLGTSLMTSFERSRDRNDIDRAVNAHRKSVSLRSHDDPRKSLCLSNLGTSLKLRFNTFENKDDIEDAVKADQEAVDLIPIGHYDRPSYLNNLCSTLMCRYNKYRERSDLQIAMKHYAEAATSHSGHPYRRLNCAIHWADIAKWIAHQDEVLRAYRCAFELLPQAVWIGLPIKNRHYILSQIGNLGRTAAAYAISIDDSALAVEWLEEGRSVVWGGLLQLRNVSNRLLTEHPEFAKRLKAMSDELANGSSRPLSREQIEPHNRQLARERDELVEQIRTLPGFEHFLKPVPCTKLFKAAVGGPIVIINVARTRCDALVLLPDANKPLIIPLRRFSLSKAERFQGYTIRSTGGRVNRSPPEFSSGWLENGFEDTEHFDTCQDREVGGIDFPGVLSELWSDIVQPVLLELKIELPTSTTTPSARVWWCPTGPLSGLPIHAAGKYTNGLHGDCVSDYVISSYATTLTSLINARKNQIPRPFKLLAVAQPDTPGQNPLPQTTIEVNLLRSRVSTSKFVPREGASATKEQILIDMKDCSWAHFACHGVQDRAEPTESGLVLNDTRLKLSEMIHHSFQGSELAFLSACQTATGDAILSDEAVHLAAGMQLAGFRGVVATMWSILDRDGPFVTERFYNELLANGDPQCTEAARALQIAITELRRSDGASFKSWVPFIHIGV